MFFILENRLILFRNLWEEFYRLIKWLKYCPGPQEGGLGSQGGFPWDRKGGDPWDPMVGPIGSHVGAPWDPRVCPWGPTGPLAFLALGDMGPWGPFKWLHELRPRAICFELLLFNFLIWSYKVSLILKWFIALRVLIFSGNISTVSRIHICNCNMHGSGVWAKRMGNHGRAILSSCRPCRYHICCIWRYGCNLRGLCCCWTTAFNNTNNTNMNSK